MVSIKAEMRHSDYNPAAKHFLSLSREDLDADLERLLNFAYTHECASNNYCLRTCAAKKKTSAASNMDPEIVGRPGDNVHYCRFSYHIEDWTGRPLEVGVRIGSPYDSAKAVSTKRSANTHAFQGQKLELIMPRNNPVILQNSRFLTHAWRGNADCTPVMTADVGCIEDYLCKYVTKEACASPAYERMYLNIVHAEKTNSLLSLITQTLLKTHGVREKPAQEAAFYGSGGKYFHFSSQASRVVSLTKPRRKVTEKAPNIPESQRNSTLPSIVQKYMKSAAGAQKVCLFEWASNTQNSKLKTKWVAVSGANTRPRWPLTEDLARNLLILYKPFTCIEQLLFPEFGPQETAFTGNKAHTDKFWTDFICSSTCPPSLRQQIMNVKHASETKTFSKTNWYSIEDHGKGELVDYLQGRAAELGLVDTNDDLTALPDEMNFNMAGPDFDHWATTFEIDEIEVGPDAGLPTTVSFDPPEILRSVTNLHTTHGRSLRQYGRQQIDQAMLQPGNTAQTRAINLVLAHALTCVTNIQNGKTTVKPLFMVMDGGAGTGKSYTLQRMAALVRETLWRHDPALHEASTEDYASDDTEDLDPVLICAPTGTAANIARGNTVHASAMLTPNASIPFDDTNPPERLVRIWRYKRYVFTDERSMLDLLLMGMFEARIRAGKMCNDIFGGLWGVVLIGDDGQLAPAVGSPLWSTQTDMGSKSRDKEFELHAKGLMAQFQTIVQLEQSMRQDASQTTFVDILTKLRYGTLKARNPVEGTSGSQPDKASPPLSENPSLLSETPCAYLNQRIQTNLSASDRNLFWPLQSSRTAESHHKKPLLHIMARNLPRHAGTKPPALPAFVVIRVDVGQEVSPLVQGMFGCSTEQECLEKGYTRISPDGQPQPDITQCPLYRLIAVPPITRQCSSPCQRCSRMMIPLEVASAVTVHTSQGRTIASKTVIHIELHDLNRWPGILYTALSRFRNTQDFALANAITPEMIDASNNKVFKVGRRTRQLEIDNQAALTVQKYAVLCSDLETVMEAHSNLVSFMHMSTQDLVVLALSNPLLSVFLTSE
mmetsp:Transcript_36429/g.91658  ORF Transcript_36429/g.91658 Transcript_36429/m.91658 type:complete len:1054 (+) Transcript_36429:3339-6500(+)